ncbi:MAG: thiamine-phosphate kinase [Proteobacteria bacterium]|nr:thiamine-phosphate kinase [Pseudomonadota bacterium]
MNEFNLIDKLKKILPPPSKKILVGIGDDALVTVSSLIPKIRMLSTVDCLVEKIHFDLNYLTPREVGWKSLAVNVSDIAAMGGTSLYSLVSLGIPERIKEKTIFEIYEGIKDCADWANIDVAGGNITRTPQDFFINITVIGEAQKPILRSGAKPGECVAVTGFPGLSAAGCYAFKKWGRKTIKNYPLATRSHSQPEPRIKFAQNLSACGVSSLIDTSDGISSELNHLSKASKVGFVIKETLLPVDEEIKRLAEALKRGPIDLMLNGGEDYELLMTFPPTKFSKLVGLAHAHGVPFTVIGHTIKSNKGPQIRLQTGKLRPITNRGWTHF